MELQTVESLRLLLAGMTLGTSLGFIKGPEVKAPYHDLTVVVDTETTGFEPSQGHRVVEIGCVELVNRIPTGKVFHKYINPERDIPAGAFAVHGLSAEFLSDKPKFSKANVGS